MKPRLKYMKGTLYMKRHMSAECLNMIRWWVDASCGVHWDCKGHTGAMMSMGKGSIVNVSRKHKLNTGSSTEAELVSISYILGMIMWCKYFMEAHGYTIENNILYQDNKSTILLANNGRMSAGKNSKHIKNRFLLITNKVVQGDLKIEHKGTDEMWGYVNTKPMQGKMFRVMRAEVMGVYVDYNDDDDERRCTHPLLMPKVESERILVTDGEVLEKAAIVVPTWVLAKKPKKGRLKGAKSPKKGRLKYDAKNLITPQANQTVKQRSVLEVDKYAPDESSKWRRVNAHFPALYKALLVNPDAATR